MTPLRWGSYDSIRSLEEENDRLIFACFPVSPSDASNILYNAVRRPLPGSMLLNFLSPGTVRNRFCL